MSVRFRIYRDGRWGAVAGWAGAFLAVQLKSGRDFEKTRWLLGKTRSDLNFSRSDLVPDKVRPRFGAGCRLAGWPLRAAAGWRLHTAGIHSPHNLLYSPVPTACSSPTENYMDNGGAAWLVRLSMGRFVCKYFCCTFAGKDTYAL